MTATMAADATVRRIFRPVRRGGRSSLPARHRGRVGPRGGEPPWGRRLCWRFSNGRHQIPSLLEAWHPVSSFPGRELGCLRQGLWPRRRTVACLVRPRGPQRLVIWLVVTAQSSPRPPPGKQPETVNVITLADHRTLGGSRSGRAVGRFQVPVPESGGIRMTTIAHPELEGLKRYKFGWADSDVAGESARRGRSSATPCWSTRSAGPTPTPTLTSARTTWRWATRPASPRSPRSSCSTS